MRSCGHWDRSWNTILGLCAVLAAFPVMARAQDEHASPPATASVEQLAARLQAMEQLNKKLAEQLEKSQQTHDAQMSQVLRQVGELSRRLNDAQGSIPVGNGGSIDLDPLPNDGQPAAPVGNTVSSGALPLLDDGPLIDPDSPVPDYTEGQFFPNNPAPGYSLPNITRVRRLSPYGYFGNGFQFQTEDQEFGVQFHLESQFDARIWRERDQIPGNSGLFLPRQRIFFNGNITRRIEYEFSINRGLGGTINILNAFVNLHFDDRFELKLGRFFTPLTYDQFAISNYWLPTPERSLFTTNVGLGRQIGAMAWGYLFDKRLDYAAGIFNGSRNSFESLSNGVDFVGYVNARPFQQSESFEFAKFLNLGTSVAFGHQDQSPVPMAFRIGGSSPNADVPGPGTTPFLILNPGVIERGDRLLGSVSAAYFYKGLSLIGEWQYGYGSYATLARPAATQVPFAGFYVSGGYFLTGEQVEQRSRVYPLRPFLPTERGHGIGPGAWEIVSRVSQLTVGDKIFTSGLAEANLWSNQAITTELGLNWYWNEYVKLYTFWLHADFADPVQFRPGIFQKSADMFWLRFQLYF
jgi:phosphate-selective porin OprO and OprP